MLRIRHAVGSGVSIYSPSHRVFSYRWLKCKKLQRNGHEAFSHGLDVHTKVVILLFSLVFCLGINILTELKDTQTQRPPMGTGNGQIQIIPFVSNKSVKYWETIMISAMVKPLTGIKSVEAHIGNKETISPLSVPYSSGYWRTGSILFFSQMDGS
jgi:hypothetical protein